jgi:hypothetical protein
MADRTRCMTAMALLIFAMAVALPAAAAGPLPDPKGARAEVQVSLCGPADRIVQKLGLRPHGPPIEAWLYDDTALTLFARGVRLRLRVAADGHSEFTLKVADQDCARLDPKLLPAGEGKCEYDVHDRVMAGAVSLDVSLGVTKTNDLLAGRETPAEALSPAQIGFLRDVVGIWPLPPGIRKLGPMHVRKYRDRGRRYDIDITQLPGGEHYAEISRKVPVGDAPRTMEVMRADLSRAGVEVCADQSAQAVNKLRALLR